MSDDKQLGNYRFIVEIQGVQAGAFRSVSGLAVKQEVIEYRLGGDRAVRRKPGRVSYNNLVLEKGFTTGSDLINWQIEMTDGKKSKKDGSIVILDDDGTEKVRYNFFKAWPLSWEGPGLVAGGGETSIEKVELAIEKVELG